MDRTRARFVVLGVPSSAGAHHAGQDLAPTALRRRGFVDRLAAEGLTIEDHGDIGGEVFTATAADPWRNLAAVTRVARLVADAVEQTRRSGGTPIVIGGDCTITLGVVAGLQRVEETVGLLYFDGQADVMTPERTRSGILDPSGVAHLLGLVDDELAHLDGRSPLLDDAHLVLLGLDETDRDSYDEELLAKHPNLLRFTDRAVRADPTGVARQAVEAISATAGSVVVHFDVDAVDSGDLPLADFPNYGAGVSLAAAGEVLRTLYSVPGLAAIVLTEVNPTHDADSSQLDRYIATVSSAMSGLAHP